MKKTVLLTVAIFFVFTSWIPVIGQGQSEETANQRAPVEFTESRRLLIMGRCAVLVDRAGQVASSVAAGQNRSFNVVNNLQTKLNEFADRADGAGLDTPQLKEDLAELSALSDQLATAWQDFLTVAESISQGVDCQSEIDARAIHDSIEAAKDAKAELRQALSSLLGFVQTTISDDLADIRQQITGDSGN